MKVFYFVAVLLVSVCGSAKAGIFDTTEWQATVSTDNRFRGISQTAGLPNIQLQGEWVDTTGLWLGSRVANVSGKEYPGGPGVETDVYGGWTHRFENGLRIFVGDYEYTYPGAWTAAHQSFITNEIFLQLRAGAFTAKFYNSLTDYFGLPHSAGTHYASLDYYQPVGDKITLVPHIGYTDFAAHPGLNYTDLKLTISYDLAPWTASIILYDNLGGREFRSYNTVGDTAVWSQAIVFSVSRNF